MSHITSMNGKIDDTTLRVARIDASTNTLQVIDYEHHEIHGGSHYFWEETTQIDNTNTWDIAFKVANTTKWTHIVWEVSSSLGSTVQLYEGDTITWDGTAETAYNNDRNSLNTSNWQEFETDPTIGAAGTLLAEATLGTSTNPNQGLPGDGLRSREIICKQDEEYRIRVISNNNGNDITVRLEWYEHTDKD